jgi:hypothetical protein
VVTPQQDCRESSLLYGVNAGICSIPETSRELEGEGNVQQDLFQGESNRNASETHGIERPEQPYPGNLDITADRIGQQIH